MTVRIPPWVARSATFSPIAPAPITMTSYSVGVVILPPACRAVRWGTGEKKTGENENESGWLVWDTGPRGEL
ncbi:hypothetical protein [Leifsonia xyli]|uniref:hypothetical protein n=1 Tax=Leifsonia xyli TaxID=1575 RepID=UPI00159EFB26|nr:hypothetical protein [Leifsonia xyli]